MVVRLISPSLVHGVGVAIMVLNSRCGDHESHPEWIVTVHFLTWALGSSSIMVPEWPEAG